MNRKKFGADRVLTPEKAPYKVEGYYFHSCRGQMTILTGYHLGDEKFAVKTEQTRLFGGYHLGSKNLFSGNG